MECLIGLGTGISTKIGEYTVQPVGRQVGYQFYYQSNLQSLKCQLSKLDVVNEDVERRVDEEKRNLREAVGEVKDWLIDVKQITDEANNILKEAENKAKMKCLHGFCPNLVLRHRLSRKSTKLVPAIDALREKEFTSFAFNTTPQEIRSNNYEALNSRTEMVSRIMDVLRKSPETNMIGVYGIGGVGKTTLVKEVAMQAADEKTLFDDVAMVLDVKSNPSIERIQKEIAEKLGLKFPDDETIPARARRLFSRIKDKKTLVILDDVWERIDLEAVGLVGVPTCKVLLTSRSREVLSAEMSAQEVFQLNVLTEEETWILFEKTAGNVVKDSSIKTVAIKVAKRCGGLPVLVVTVASALKNRSRLSAWNDALRRMKKLDNEEFTEKTYLALEWSYNQLNGKELKQLFLLCGLFAGDSNSIDILDIFKYSMGLGLWQELDTLGQAWDALNALLEKLKDSCLLLDSDDNRCVKMHDLVNDVASRIAHRDQHVLKIAREGELKEWPGVDFLEKSTMIILQTTNIPKLPEFMQCKELKLFHLVGEDADDFLAIPSRIFEEMKKLRVLDITELSIPTLPPSLEFLNDLLTLCLGWCRLEDIALLGKLEKLEILSFCGSNFKKLPSEIGQLTRLRLLDLTGCDELEIISPGVLSSLTRLEELRMRDSFNKWEAEGFNITERKNASLSELKHLSRLSTLHIHIMDANILPTCLFSNDLERYQIQIGAAWEWDDDDLENLNKLKLELTAGHELEQAGVNMLLKRTEELHLDGTEAGSNTVHKFHVEDFEHLKRLHVRNAEFALIINDKGVTRNLTKLVVSDINGSRFLLSSSMATSLVQLRHLEVSRCPVMEEIISTEGSDEENMENIFPKLEYLEFEDLPNVTSFCSRNYVEFQSLKALRSESGNEIEEIDSKEQLENVVEPFLFDEKLGFPSLKTLRLYGLNKLIRIWHKQNSPQNFKSLQDLKIQSCERLKSVFPSSMVTNLNLLMELKVLGCGGLEVIVENEDGLQTTPKRFVFPKVESVTLHDLPQLGSFYPGMHVTCWPSLKYLRVDTCNKVELFAQELSSFQRKHESTNDFPVIKRSLFLIDKDSFPKLDYLNVEGMEEFWDCSFPVKFLNKQENLQGVFHNITKLVVRSIYKSRFLLSSPMARSLVQLTHLEICNCPIMEGIVSTKKSDEDNMENMLPKLQCLELYNLPNLTIFSSNENYNEIDEEGDSRENAENVVEHFLFDKKARFPNLKDLTIRGLEKLRGICHNQLSPECFKNLETIYISKCESLKNVFSSSMAQNLQQLRDMTVGDCEVLEEIVSNEEGPQTVPPTFVFSNVTEVEFEELPQLRSFYPGKHISSWPSLKTLKVSECDKVEIFSQEFPSLLESTNHTPIKGTLFSMNKLSFHNLEQLYIAGCHGLQYLITHSAAKSLMQLKMMLVEDCKGLVEIVRSIEGADDSGNEIAFSKLIALGLTDLPRLRGFCSGNYRVIKLFPSLKTLSMSNRLKLIIFPGDEMLHISDFEENSDTDINSDSDGDSETVTEENDEIMEENDEIMDIGADGKHEDETTQRRNKNEGTKVDETVIVGSRVEAAAVDDYGALTLPSTSLDSSCPKLIPEDIPPTSNIQTPEDRGVSTELISAKPLTVGSIHENVIPPNDSLGDQGQENAKLEEEPPKRRAETNPSQTLAPNAAEACQSLDTINAQSTDHRNSNPSILVNEVDQDIDIVGKMEGNIEMAPILKVQVQPTETNPSITDTVETASDQGSVCDALRDTTDGTSNFPSLQPLQAMQTDEELQQVDVFRESDRSLDDKLSALAAITNKTKVILSAEDEEAKAVVLNVQAESSKIQYDVQAQERLKEALQHLKDKKLCNAKKLSSAMTSLDLIPQLSLNALALRRKISALQEEEQALQVEKANLNSNVAGIKSSYSAVIQKRAALQELHQEIQNLQAKASTMAGEISFLEGHIESILMDPIAFEENACKIDVNNTTMHEVETELVNIEASLDRHTNVVTKLLKSLF